VAALQRALALAEVGEAAAAVAGDLHLEVAGARQELLDVDAVVAEGRAGLGTAAGVGGGDLVRLRHDAHAATAAAGDGLDDHRRPAEAGEEGARLVERHGRAAAGQHRHASALGEGTGARLVAEQRQCLGARADERQASGGAAAREVGLLGEEAVAGMHGVAAGGGGDGEQLRGVEVGGRADAAQRVRIVRVQAVQRRVVVLGEHRNRGDAERGGAVGDADGDLAAVGDQQAGARHAGRREP
jgi:hypothetical protein